MTTEQMDWLDDERAGRHRLKPGTTYTSGGLRASGAWSSPMNQAFDPSADATTRVRELLQSVGELSQAVSEEVIVAIWGHGVSFTLSSTEGEGEDRLDHKDEAIDRFEKTLSSVVAQAEEPIEDRLHRAWLNGYREGSDRAHRGIRWDHS
jgi:hypothetical protein